MDNATRTASSSRLHDEAFGSRNRSGPGDRIRNRESESGGYLLADSQVGVGSTFTVYLPHHESVDAERTVEEHAVVPRGTETILVVEDQAAGEEVIERTLRQLGYEVLVAADSTEAMKLIATATPLLLITDVRLPGVDGPALAVQIAERRPGIAVLFVSGYASETMIDGGVLGEDAAFLAKPFTPDELGQRVRQLLDGVVRP